MARKPRRRDTDAGDVPVSAIAWKDRIVRMERVAPDQLMAHPLNARLHGRMQQQVMTAALDDVGLIQAVIVNERTGRLVDGHMRVTLALRSEQPTIPVIFVDLTEEEELRALATFDPIGDLAGLDKDNLEMLLSEVSVSDAATMALLADLASAAGLNTDAADEGEELDDAASELSGFRQLPEGKVFESTLRFDMPPLDPDKLAEIPPNLEVWAKGVSQDDGEKWFMHIAGGDSTRGLPFDRAMLAFYCDDARFESYFREPHRQFAKVLNVGIGVMIAPNYSLWGGQPRAVHLWSIYRSRYVARYAQEAGLRVIPDFAASDERSLDFCMVGIPKGAPAIAMQVQTQDIGRSPRARQVKEACIRAMLKELEPRSLLVYGGPPGRQFIEGLKLDVPVTFIANWTEVSRVRKGG